MNPTMSDFKAMQARLEKGRNPDAVALKAHTTDAAPDKAREQAFADILRELPLPELKTSEALDLLPAKIEELALWIEARIERL
jgi:hypothetical protein